MEAICKYSNKCWRLAYTKILKEKKFKNDAVPTRLELFQMGYATIEMMQNAGKGGIFCEKFPHIIQGRFANLCPSTIGIASTECQEYKKEQRNEIQRQKRAEQKKNFKREYIPPDVKIQVFRRDKFKCRYCGVSNNTKKCQIDHIIPVSRGGTNDIDNLQLACRDCNLKKYNKIYAEEKRKTEEKGE
jgi:5-methylcytosine-specific restriction endonuclease McrA